MTPKVVFDCMVFLQGAGRPNSPARECFRQIDQAKAVLCVSAEVLLEVRDVLTRPKTLKRFPLLTSAWIETFVQNAESKAIALAEIPRLYTLVRDPKDEPYLNLALVAGASFLVTRDKDLLDLMADSEFRQRFPTLTILDPPAFLKALEASQQTVSVPEADPAAAQEA